MIRKCKIYRIIPVIVLYVFFSSCKKNDILSPQELIDIDGNSYPIININGQYWMTKNLKTKRLNDGTEIPFITDDQEWSELSSAGYCWYNNNKNYENEFGALYNWYTVNTNKVCPKGWHVPLDDEWAKLEVYLQNNGFNYNGFIDTDNDRKTNNKIGKAMTSSTAWDLSENEGAIGNSDYREYRNMTGFSILPGGYRDASGDFWYMNWLGNYWTATEHNNSNAWYRRFLSSSSKVIRDDHVKRDGFSIRCIKNQNTD